MTYDVDLALPGHGPLIRNFRERIGQLRTHHDERLALMEQTAGTGANAYDVCVQVFPVATYSSHQMRFALAETLAHLEYLVEQERLVRNDRNGVPVYRRHQPVF